MHRFPQVVLMALPVVASLHAAPAFAAVIDEIAIERHDSAARVRLRLTGPVHFLRYYSSERGRVLQVQLQALAPENFGERPFPDEVKRGPDSAVVPRFTARVSLDPRCDPAPHPVCITIRFERTTRAQARLGEDSRSLLLDFDSKGEVGSPAAGEKP